MKSICLPAIMIAAILQHLPKKKFTAFFCASLTFIFLTGLSGFSANAQRVDEDARLPAQSQGEPQLPVPANPNLPTLFLIMPEIAIANHGESGESLRGFINENRLDKLDKIVRPGDWLFIQMGHNDQKEKGEGVGAFTTYMTDLKRFVTTARNRGVTPVLITSVSRMTFDASGKITNSLGDYPEAVRQVAREDNVALIDLQATSGQFYEALGPDNAHKAFANSSEHTHHNDYGSYELAKCIVQGIKDDRLPLAKYLYPVATFDSAKPDPVETFDIPAEPLPIILQKPYGH
jgi:lysophospholipase L1-like esterase